jgi:hypothetical protein
VLSAGENPAEDSAGALEKLCRFHRVTYIQRVNTTGGHGARQSGQRRGHARKGALHG